MAITADAMSKAEVTYCYERDELSPGTQRQLPWCFVRFGDVGEERKYLAPVDAIGLLADRSASVYRAFAEYMPFRRFPLESGRPARVNNADDTNKPGPVGIHFFGGV